MRLKTWLLTALFSIGFLFPSCDYGNNCGGGKPIPQFFDIEGFHLRNYKVAGEFNCCGRTELDSGTVISVDSFRLNMQFDVSYFGKRETLRNPFSFGFMGSALACDTPPPGFNGSQEQIESLVVITLIDWDSLHLAGDTINDLLYIYDFSQKKELDDFLANNVSFIKEEEIFLRLHGASDSHSSFSARVNLKLKNGEEYSTDSEVVTIR